MSLPLCAGLAGCVLPTELHELEQPPNYRPVFITSLAGPPFGPLPLSRTDRIDLSVAADDANLDDTLYARLFRLGNAGATSRAYTGYEITLTFPSTPVTCQPTEQMPESCDRFRRSGDFFPTGLQLCTLYKDGGELFVVVADRPFCKPQPNDPNDPCLGKENTAPGGLTDENLWELECQ
jgi:hypothetical protein